MTGRLHLVAAAALAFASGLPMPAQTIEPVPVDRNVGDTGANAASQRVAQPGIGQFGVGSLLLDRFGRPADQPYEPQHYDPYAADPRVSSQHRFLLRAPGITALMNRPDYIGLSPTGSWVRNRETVDGTEVLTLGAANLVFVLSPELLQPVSDQPRRPHYEPNPNDHANRVQPRVHSDPYALMRESRVNRRAYAAQPLQQPAATQDSHYRHPAIIERQRQLREEREREAAERAQREAESESEEVGVETIEQQPTEAEANSNRTSG